LGNWGEENKPGASPEGEEATVAACVASRVRLGVGRRVLRSFRGSKEMGELLPSLAADGLGLRIGLKFFLLSGPKFRYAKASQAHPLGPPLPMSTFERLSRQILEIDEDINGASLSTESAS